MRASATPHPHLNSYPSLGHLGLGVLMQLGRALGLWTTNFDTLIEDATLPILGSTGRIVVATPETARVGVDAINEQRWPVLVKLHGDFRSSKLKNTSDELRAQDAQLRHALVASCRRFGLMVVGYSGRDDSVMDALDEAIDGGHGYPAGLFWFCRPGSSPSARVLALVNRAARAGINSHVIEASSFDELVRDLLNLIDIPPDLRDRLPSRPRITDAPLPDPQGGFPVIRLNAMPFLATPQVCRRIVCDIGGLREVREAVQAQGANVVASRRASGVIAFGSDREIDRAFAPYNITSRDLHTIGDRRLRYDSQELGLLYDALAHALSRNRPIKVERRHRAYILIADLDQAGDECYLQLRRAAGAISGTVPGTTLRWREAARLRLDFRLGRLWLLLEPTIWLDNTADPAVAAAGKAFIRARLAGRHNRPANAVLDAWLAIVAGSGDEIELRAFGVADGCDAVFRLLKKSSFSARRKNK